MPSGSPSLSHCMPIDHVDDWERRIARQDAWWHREVLDRPPCTMTFAKPVPEIPWPVEKPYASHRERWMDTDRIVAKAIAAARNTVFCGDALPTAWPNLGPEVFSAFFGLDMQYTAETSWAIPVIHDWARTEHVRFSRESFYWKKLVEMTDTLLEAGKGLYYVGLTDFHPGGDALAAFRDPADLNTDLLLYPDEIRRMLRYVNQVYFETFDFFYDKLVNAGQALTCWAGIVSSKKWYVPSNDFSCMISREMFRDFFLPGIVEECRHLEASLYHLDGPGALRHLDDLLDIPELNAIQWVFGAGNGTASDWISVYQRCQAAGKGIQIFAHVNELDTLIENLRPEGVWLALHGVTDQESANAVLQRLLHWTH